MNTAGNWAISSWQEHQVDAQYGYPRTWQTDAVVGHADSADHPTHFVFINQHAHVLIFEIPGGDPAHTRIYLGPRLLGPNGDTIPVTASFTDVNGDGRVDMVLHIGEQIITYLNDGTQFKPQQ